MGHLKVVFLGRIQPYAHLNCSSIADIRESFVGLLLFGVYDRGFAENKLGSQWKLTIEVAHSPQSIAIPSVTYKSYHNIG